MGFLLRLRLVVLVVVLGVLGFFGYQLKNVSMPQDPMESMYPAGHPFLKGLRAIKQMAPEPNMLVCILAVKTGDIYNGETLKKIDEVTKGLMQIEGVNPGTVTSLTRKMDHYDNTENGLDIVPVLGRTEPKTPEDFLALKRRVAVNPMGPGRYIAYDGRAVMITAEFLTLDQLAQGSYQQLPDRERSALTLEQYRKKVEANLGPKLLQGMNALKAKVDDANHILTFMGEEVIKAQMTAMGTQQIGVAAGVMLAVIVILLALYFRTILGVLLPILALAISAALGMGIFASLGYLFHPMALLYPLILGLCALAYTVLVLDRFYRAYTVPDGKHDAIICAWGNIPLLAAILTGALVTLSLCLARIPMVKELGYLGLGCLAGAFVCSGLMVPLLISYLPLKPKAAKEPRVSAWQSLSSALTDLSQGGGRYFVLLILAAVIVTGGLALKRVAVGDNIPGSSYLRPNHPWNQCFNLFTEKFMGPNQLLVYVQAQHAGGLIDPEALGAIGDFSDYLKYACGAKDSIAFDMMVQMARYTMSDGSPKWQTVPETRKQIEGLAGMILEQGGIESFMDKTFSRATISPFFPRSDAASIDTYALLMQAYIDSHPSAQLEFSLGGGLLGMTKLINDGVKADSPRIFIAAFLVLLVLGIVCTCSLIKDIALFLSIAAAQAALILIMAAAGIYLSLSLIPAIVAALSLGPLFGYCLFRGGSEKGGNILFTGILVFAASLPWFFIGLKFQATMAMIFGIMVMLETVTALLFVPALAGRKRLDGTISEEGGTA